MQHSYLTRKYAAAALTAGSRKRGWLSLQNRGGGALQSGFWIIVIRCFFLSFITAAEEYPQYGTLVLNPSVLVVLDNF